LVESAIIIDPLKLGAYLVYFTMRLKLLEILVIMVELEETSDYVAQIMHTI